VKFHFDNGCEAAARPLPVAVGDGNFDEVKMRIRRRRRRRGNWRDIRTAYFTVSALFTR